MSQYYDDIPIGKENAISKEELQRKWGMTERGVRAKIADLRQQDNGDNLVIVSLSSSRGFYRTDNIKEILAYKKETLNRARHLYGPLRKVNRILEREDTQLELVPVNNFKAMREAAGIMAKDVIAIIQKQDPTFNKIIMSHIENNKCFPTSLQASIMAQLYGCTVAELTGMEITSYKATELSKSG